MPYQPINLVSKMCFLTAQTLMLTLLLFFKSSLTMAPFPDQINFTGKPGYTNNAFNITYHNGPILSSEITVNIIWYGKWAIAQKQIIREFINSISGSKHQSPSVSDWWKIVQLYTDKTGSNVSATVRIGIETDDRLMSHGKNLTNLSIQSVVIAAMQAKTHPLLIDPQSGIYLVLTADDVLVENFCYTKCGTHDFISPSVKGYKVPYLWVGNSAKQCPRKCAYPFTGVKPLKSPNGDLGIDGMVNIIGANMAAVATDPFSSGWYWSDHYFGHPHVEINQICRGTFGPRSGVGNIGKVFQGDDGSLYNIYGIHRRFLVQWLWDFMISDCTGPNAVR